MSEKKVLEKIVFMILKLLVEKDYQELEKHSKGIRLSAQDIERTIKEYNCQLIIPPPDGYELMDVIEVRGDEKWSIVMPLWSQEEGRSDLSIELTLIKDGDSFKFEIDDLHVL